MNYELILRLLVETEREFARMSVTDGMSEAFLRYLGGESVIFRHNQSRGQGSVDRDSESPFRPFTSAPLHSLLGGNI